MDQQQQQQSTVTAGDNSKAMWEYEAPQYCDFSSADTFVDTDPTVDKFFLTDHDSTKENDESMAASAADGSSDADIFATPLTTRSGQKKSLGTSSSCYRTPKSSSAAAFDSEAATPVAPPVFLTGRLSTLRQTPLREIYNQGGKPLHEAGRRVSVFGKKSAKKAAAAANNKDNNHKDNHNNSRRETFDMGNVAEAIEEVSASVAASKEEEEEEKSSDKENHNGPPAAADELMSEEEEEAVKKSEETVVEAFHSVDAEKELSEEAAAASAAPSLADDSSALNSSRRSSYIVKSPSIRVVHFADESVRNSGGLEALVEDSNELQQQQQQTTPVVHNEGTSKSSLKIKARQLTPMVVKEEKGKKVTAGNIVSKTATTATTTKASTGSSKNPLSIQGLLRNRLSKKYIKRFSKSMEEEKEKEEEAKKKKDEEKGHGPSSSAPAAPAAPAAKPKSTVIGLTKKRVTIAAVPAKSATTTTTFAQTSTTSGKRGLSLKGSTSTSAGRRFTTAASMLLRKKSLTSAAAGAKTPLKSGANANNNNKGDAPATTGPSRPSPYLGLSVLNAHFMSKYCRNYTPPTAAASSALKKQRPKATVPVSPNLHTSTRCTMRKAHTMPNLAPAAPKPAPVIRKPLPTKPAPTTTAPAAAFVPTKAITPKFSTEARLKLWHVKHGDQADGGAAAPGGGKNGGGLLFKARPMPNFKRMQAAAAKQAAAAIEKGKHAVKPIHQEKK